MNEHDHTCTGPLVTYSTMLVVAFGAAVFTVAVYIGISLWERLGDAEDRNR